MPKQMKDVNVRQLIAEVKQRRPLWDRAHDMRHERSLIEALWEEVGIVLGQNARHIKGKWKTLKDTYRKEAKKTLNDPTYRSTWASYEPLSFLYSQLGIESNMDPLNDQNSSNSIADHENKIEFVYENIDLPIENGGDNYQSSSGGVKRKHEESSGEYVTEYKGTNDNYPDDEDLCFFKSLIPHVKQLSPQRKMLMRMKIQEMIYKEVYSSDLQE